MRYGSALPIHSLFFFNDTATTEIYTLSLHDALPISLLARGGGGRPEADVRREGVRLLAGTRPRSEEHPSELQSRSDLVCRLLLETNRGTCGSPSAPPRCPSASRLWPPPRARHRALSP